MDFVKLAVVGAGPVGIYFAKLCLDNGHKVTLIESGNVNQESKLLSKDNYVFKSPSALPVGVHKIGGGSNLWRGRISEFQELDFGLQGATQDKKWPFEKNELVKHYAKIYNLLELETVTDKDFLLKYFANEVNQLSRLFEIRLFRFCKSDFFIKLFRSIEYHPDLEVLTNHFCKSITKSRFTQELELELLTETLTPKKITFDAVVIACGTLQTTALLQRSETLLSKDTIKTLGHFLMEHLEGYVGKAWISNKNEKLSLIHISEPTRPY